MFDLMGRRRQNEWCLEGKENQSQNGINQNESIFHMKQQKIESSYNLGQIILAFSPLKTKNAILHFYKMSCIFADFDARRNSLDKDTVPY